MNPETRTKAGLWLVVLFALGGAIGAVFGYSFGHRTQAATVVTAPNLTEPERRAKRVEEMTREVGLTAEQGAKVDEIIRGAHQEMKEIHEKADRDVDAARQKARDQIRLLLTAEQKPKFETMVQRMDAERKSQAGR